MQRLLTSWNHDACVGAMSGAVRMGLRQCSVGRMKCSAKASCAPRHIRSQTRALSYSSVVGRGRYRTKCITLVVEQ